MDAGDWDRVDAGLLWDIFGIHSQIGALLRSEYGGLKGYEIAMLLMLCTSKEPPSIGAIAEALGVTSQYASSVSTSLVERGYAEFNWGESDRRCKLVHLTNCGRSVCRERFLEPGGADGPFSLRYSENDLDALSALRRQVGKAAEAFGA